MKEKTPGWPRRLKDMRDNSRPGLAGYVVSSHRNYNRQSGDGRGQHVDASKW